MREINQEPVGVISDVHAGVKDKLRWKTGRYPALRDFLKYYRNEVGCRRLILNGDILDDRALDQSEREKKRGKRAERADRFERQAGDIRDLLERWMEDGDMPLAVDGNHDGREHFTADDMGRYLGPHRHATGLIHLDPSGLTVTHGHIISCKRLMTELLHDLKRSNQVDMLARDKPFQDEMAAVLSCCDTGRKVRNMLAAVGLDAMGAAVTGGVENMIQLLRHWIQDVLPRKEQKRLLWPMGAAKIAAAMGSRAVAFGHTHVHGVHLVHVAHPRTGLPMEVLAGNSGSFQQGNPTCLLVEPDKQQMSVLEWTKKNGVRKVSSARLQEDGARFDVEQDALAMA